MRPLTRILIIEDDLDAARRMCVGMASYGHDVAVANDSVSALYLARASNPDFVLLDSGVPEHDELGLRLRTTLGPDAIFISVSIKAKRVDPERMNELLVRLHQSDEKPQSAHRLASMQQHWEATASLAHSPVPRFPDRFLDHRD